MKITDWKKQSTYMIGPEDYGGRYSKRIGELIIWLEVPHVVDYPSVTWVEIRNVPSRMITRDPKIHGDLSLEELQAWAEQNAREKLQFKIDQHKKQIEQLETFRSHI